MTYKRILVPIDGSHVVDIHNAFGAGAESSAYLADLIPTRGGGGAR
jgi:hypothetical protein